VLHWSDGQDVSESQACELVAAMRVDGCNDTIVRNRMATSRAGNGLHGIESMLLVPVARSQQEFGWLLLLNRSGEASHLIANHDILGLDEFGTEEAGMAEAAASMLAAHARNVQLLEERENLMISMIQTLLRTLETRDEYTCGHSDRVARISQMLASQMGVPESECEEIYRAGLLHDIGKVGVPDQVLSKPGRLTEEEFDLIKQHPMIGYRILKDLRAFEFVLPGVRWHHERQDGRGYPDGLTGDEIPLMARVMAVADGFDAMTSNRPYRDGMPFEKAESIMREGAGTQWDADVVAAYLKINDVIQDFCRNHRMSSVMCGLSESMPTAAMVARDSDSMAGL
jgi:HD-GYP domain-containing protein (c-di-GMP phosphodiesterase class II)